MPLFFTFSCIDDLYVWFMSEFLPEILSTGLKEERLSIVNLILSTLKSRVSPLLSIQNLKTFVYANKSNYIFHPCPGCSKQIH